MSDESSPPGAGVETTMPARTTPTWEMELLISGATVFGLMQLPGLADRWLFGAYNAGPPAMAGMVLPLWIYVKFALLTLIATFIVHLCLRGYWIALVGLSSVYPGGVRWDYLRSRTGPNAFAATLEQFGDLPAAIERADNRGSLVFGVGFGLALAMVVPIVIVLVVMGVMWLCESITGPDPRLIWIGFALFLVIAMPYALILVWDKYRGDRIAAGGREARLLYGSLRFLHRIGMGRSSNPLLLLFASNAGSRQATLVMTIAMTLLFGATFLQAVGDRFGWSGGSYVGLPDDLRYAERVVLPVHYASQRGDAPVLAPVPTIPDPVVRGPYLRLFVPYFPQRHAHAMRRECPEALRDDADARTRLDCFAALHAIAIDGEAVTVPFDAAEDPATGQRGGLAMIPVGALAEGRHELTIMPPQRERRAADAPPPKPFRIPFWR